MLGEVQAAICSVRALSIRHDGELTLKERLFFSGMRHRAAMRSALSSNKTNDCSDVAMV